MVIEIGSMVVDEVTALKIKAVAKTKEATEVATITTEVTIITKTVRVSRIYTK